MSTDSEIIARSIEEPEPGLEPDPVAERWHSITIDTRTGYVLEYTDRGGSNPALVPDSVPDERRTFTITVVDEIP